MIETHDLSKNFDNFVAVDGIDLKVKSGEVLALLGPNGAGKTTTVRMLSSVLKPTRGWAKIAGFDVVNHAPKVRGLVGVLTENHGLYNRMPAVEYLNFFGEVYNLDEKKRKQRTVQLLENFGLTEAQHRKIGEYSKGMRQKLALARALLHEPPVLLLDEPTSAMDPESAKQVRDSIKELRLTDRSVIICTHNLSEAEELADRIAIIRNGNIIANGTPDSLKRKYLGPPEYEVKLETQLNGTELNLPENAELTSRDEYSFRFSSPLAEAVNPSVVRALITQNYSVVSVHEVPRSLEQVYLNVMDGKKQEEANHAK